MKIKFLICSFPLGPSYIINISLKEVIYGGEITLKSLKYGEIAF